VPNPIPIPVSLLTPELLALKAEYTERIIAIESTKGKNSKSVTQADYDGIVEKFNSLSSGRRKGIGDFQVLKMYELFEEGDGTQFLVKKGSTRRIVPIGKVYDAVYYAHISTNHGGRDRMRAFIRNLFYNVTASQLAIFSNYCDECQSVKLSRNKEKEERERMSADPSSAPTNPADTPSVPI
jgi:hypothetical protein